MRLAAALTELLGCSVDGGSERPVSGGSIHSCARFETAHGPIFVKHGATDRLGMFQAEAAGLAELTRANAARIPNVIAVDAHHERAFLVLEWIEMTSSAHGGARLGELLAHQHRVTRSRFGWDRDNSIGATPQHNADDDDWISFFREQRLRPQLGWAAEKGARAELLDAGYRLCERLEDFFGSHRPLPALLHGDLWGGNWGVDPTGMPVLFDPAVYFGDREADLAMTRLFGGFDASFYSAYAAAWPLPAGADTRVTLYNLYHVLNHFNLFGGGYLRQSLAMIQSLLAEVGH